jgi:uncharacterized cupredoxin-like copper-binding protein
MPTKSDRTDMAIGFGEYQNDLMVYPRKVTLEKGNPCRFIVINPSDTFHIVAAAEFSDKALTSALIEFPLSVDLTKSGLAEGIAAKPREKLEWYFMPTKEGTYKIGGAQDAYAKARMHAMIEVF